MNRLSKITASAVLLAMMAATPASAIYIEGAVYDPENPQILRTLVMPADESAPVVAVPISAPVDGDLHYIMAIRAEPAAILINGSQISYDQQPVTVQSTLMLPLRAIVEGAGGTIDWDGETQTVTVRLADRTATFVIGQAEAEMNQDGVNYIQRNMIAMSKAPMLAGGRTLIAADALTSVLGLMERPDATGALNLVAAPQPEQPAPPVDQVKWMVEGTIKEIESLEDRTRILVNGPHGEGDLTWFSFTAETPITVVENGVERAGAIADLAVAQKVELQHRGPIALSYPGQGWALAITVHK